MENEKEQIALNNNNQLESIQTDMKQLVAKASIGIGLLALLLVLFWFYKSNKSVEDEIPQDEPSNNLIDSVKQEKDFTLYAESEPSNVVELRPSQDKSNINSFMPFEEEVAKPRIIKGMGVAVITQKTNDSSNTSSSQTLVGRPQKIFEFGQDGMDNLAMMDKVIDKVSANIPQYDEFGNVIPKKPQDNTHTSNANEVFQPTSAYFSEFNQTFLLPKGSFIPCSLKTRIVSELKGGIACIVANDIYSANGQVLLIEKGSTITGSYANAELNNASTRLFVIWQEIKTPNNIVIPVSSGASDTLGGSGINGHIDKHYIDRFGAAVMLSVIDGSIKILGNYIKDSLPNGGNSIQFNEASQLASMALRQTMNIKPTLYKNHGDLVGVYINKDIDFSKVYHLRRR